MQSNEDTRAGASLVISSLASRLARSPASEWRFDEADAALVLEALLDQINLDGDLHHLRNASAQYLTFARKMRRLNSLNSWTAVTISALFFATFMLHHRFPDAAVAGVWAVIAAIWAQVINRKDDSGGEQT